MKKLLIAGLAFLLLASAGFCDKKGVLDSFNDKDLKDNYGGEWKTEDDSSQGGDSTAFIKIVKGRKNSKGALRFDYTLGPRFNWRYSTFTLVYPGVRDWSKYKGIKFWIRGSGNSLRVELCIASVKDWDFHSYIINKTPAEWQEVFVPFSDVKQLGNPVVPFNPALINRLYFVASSTIDGEKGFVEIDDISLVK